MGEGNEYQNVVALNDQQLGVLRRERDALEEQIRATLKQVDTVSVSAAKRRDRQRSKRDRLHQMLRTELDNVTHAVQRAEVKLVSIEDTHHEFFIQGVPKQEEVTRMAILREQAASAKQRYLDTHERFERIEYQWEIYKMMLERVNGELVGRAAVMAQLVVDLRTKRESEAEAHLSAAQSAADRRQAEREAVAGSSELERYREAWAAAIAEATDTLKTQQARDIEREMRLEQRRKIALDAAGLNEDKLDAKERKLATAQASRRLSTTQEFVIAQSKMQMYKEAFRKLQRATGVSTMEQAAARYGRTKRTIEQLDQAIEESESRSVEVAKLTREAGIELHELTLKSSTPQKERNKKVTASEEMLATTQKRLLSLQAQHAKFRLHRSEVRSFVSGLAVRLSPVRLPGRRETEAATTRNSTEVA